MSLSTIFKAVEPYIVKIETPAGAGTGFFFAYNGDKSIVGIATALHVVEDAHDWRQPIKIIQVESGKELFLSESERYVWVDYGRDSAAILLRTQLIVDTGLALPDNMLPMLPGDKYKVVGSSFAWAGYPAIDRWYRFCIPLQPSEWWQSSWVTSGARCYSPEQHCRKY